MDPVEGPVPDFLEEAKRIIAQADQIGVIVRLMGATAIKLHCPNFRHLYDTFDRKLTDLDFVAYSKDFKKVEDLFKRSSYVPRKLGYAIAVAAHGERAIFDDSLNNRVVDVFFDRLKMCHTIEFKGRLELDYPTITLADILLEKMQIVTLNEKDIKDTVVLIREHSIGDVDKETVNARYIADSLCEDWGFFYTVTTNLEKIKECLSQFGSLSVEDSDDVANKIDKLLESIRSKPKTLRWKMRARIGTSKKWYDDVEETVRGNQ